MHTYNISDDVMKKKSIFLFMYCTIYYAKFHLSVHMRTGINYVFATLNNEIKIHTNRNKTKEHNSSDEKQTGDHENSWF